MRAFYVFAFLIFSVLPVVAFAQSEGIAAVVNQDAISIKDLNDRLHLVVASSGLPPTQEIREKLTGQVLNDLIEEQLKMQEAKRLSITVSQEEVQQAFSMLAQQNNLTLEQFLGAMKHDGINMMTMERQIRAQVGWSKVIQQVMRPQVNVTDNDVDDYLARLGQSKGKSEYLLAEIFLPVDEKASEADAKRLGEKLSSEISSGKTPFFKVAQQFSSAAGAARGGDLGWIQQGQLQPEIEQAVIGLQKDQVSQPVRTVDGYHLVFLRDVRVIADETIPSRDKVYSTIGVQRLERMQARQLLDLKTSAFIENRVQS
ncbi:MAG: peptidylprolyl isomerase [Alphaproteobacteria bacterium]